MECQDLDKVYLTFNGSANANATFIIFLHIAFDSRKSDGELTHATTQRNHHIQPQKYYSSAIMTEIHEVSARFVALISWDQS